MRGNDPLGTVRDPTYVSSSGARFGPCSAPGAPAGNCMEVPQPESSRWTRERGRCGKSRSRSAPDGHASTSGVERVAPARVALHFRQLQAWRWDSPATWCPAPANSIVSE